MGNQHEDKPLENGVGYASHTQRDYGVSTACDAVGRRVLISALVALPIIAALILAQLLLDPFRSEKGFDVLMLAAAIPSFLVGYGIYAGLTHVVFERYRTRQLVQGLILHVILILATTIVLWYSG